MNKKTQMKVTLLGTSLMVQSDDNQEQLNSIIHYFERKIAEVKKKLPSADPLKIAIITALNIIDEMFKIQASYEQKPVDTNNISEAQEVEEITRNIIQKLDSIIQA